MHCVQRICLPHLHIIVETMRARNAALFFIAFAFVCGARPSVVMADQQIFISDIAFSNMPVIPGTGYDNRQTALKAGDSPTLVLYTHSTLTDPPVVSVDLSQLGILNAATMAPELMNPNRYIRSYMDSLPTYLYVSVMR